MTIAPWAKTTSSGSSGILLGFTKNALNSAIFGPIKIFFAYTHILGCWKHIFGKKNDIYVVITQKILSPELIPFGWGHNHDDDNVADDDGMINEVEVDRATLKDDDVYAGSPHVNVIEIQDIIKHNQEGGDDESIPKDIFDGSLRYSGVDRPRLNIDRSSPVPQRHGSFEDSSDKIANLFKIQMWFLLLRQLLLQEGNAHHIIIHTTHTTQIYYLYAALYTDVSTTKYNWEVACPIDGLFRFLIILM